MSKRYYISEDQFETIYHQTRMFEYNAEQIEELCSSEKDDIVYGFELGEIHTNLRNCFAEMLKLEEEILKQEIKQDKK